MLPSGVDGIRGSGLTGERVLERLGVVGPVAHAGRRVPEGDPGHVEQGGVRGAECVPPHARTMEVSHCVHEGVTGTSVVAPDGKLQLPEDVERALAEGNGAVATLRFRLVPVPGSGERATDVEDMAVYVAWLYGDGLAPPESGEEDKFGDLAPHAGHPGDDLLGLAEGQLMPPRRARTDTRPIGRER